MKLILAVNNIQLNEGKRSKVEILRAGVVFDRNLKITASMLEEMVKHFQSDTYGQGDNIPVNLSHDRDGAAAGWIKRVWVEGVSLMAEIEWTSLGEEMLKDGLYKFISIEFAPSMKSPKDGKPVTNVLVGAGLTNIPAMKSQVPIALSENISKLLSETSMFKTILQSLKARAFATAEDKKLMNEAFASLSDAEKAEFKADVEAITAMAEKPKEEPKKPEAKKDGEEGKEKKQVTMTEEETAQKLSEMQTKIDAQNAETLTLKEKLAAKEMSETFDQELALSEKRKIGYTPAAKAKVVAFMTGLSESQRNEFKALLAEVKQVDLSTKGGAAAEAAQSDEAKFKEADVKAREMSEKTKKPLHECLSEVYVAMGLVK